jgi:hypothetical protein
MSQLVSVYILLTEKNRDKTVLSGAEFKNRNEMCMKSTLIVHDVVRVVVVLVVGPISTAAMKASCTLTP